MKLFVCAILILLCFMECSCLLSWRYHPEKATVTETPSPHFRYDYTFDEDTQSWYKLHQIPDKWFEAHNRCKNEGAELASPLNGDMLETMLDMVKDKALNGVYTGIHSTFSYGDFYTLKGVPLDRLPVSWSPSATAPDREMRCALLYHNGTVGNENCDRMHPYICYRYNKNESLRECGTFDTDYKYVSTLNTCYKFHPVGETWNDSFKICSAEGGHLLIINNETERKHIVSMFAQYDTKHVWGTDLNHAFVGFIKWQKTGGWVTIHDESLVDAGYATWASGEPNRIGNNEFCGSIDRSAGLNDAPCDITLPFICEKKPDSLLKYTTASAINKKFIRK